ncbi:hypothetical protein [Streptomyces sp. R33]|uniref:Nitrogen fixation protein n=1 Tax=Streptomyces sp. R33 TaxID=3238629 RepID=A0AB39YKC7_9ACTN
MVIATLGKDGRLGYVRPALPVDEQFNRTAREHGDPESRFRFADTCAQDACEHWSGRQCGLVGRLIDSPRAQELSSADDVPRCAIRSHCRWFAQSGKEACRVCPVVVYRPTTMTATEATGDALPSRPAWTGEKDHL